MKQTIKVADKPTADEIKSTVESNAEKLDGIAQSLESGGMLSDPSLGLAALKQSLDELKNYVGNGKKNVANAITGKGIPTATDADFATLVQNIESIVTLMQGTQDATAEAAHILSGASAYVKGVKVNGSMPNRGAVSQSLGVNGSYVIPQGYHNGSGTVSQSVPTQGVQTIMPKSYAQSIPAGRYLTGQQTIAGDGNLVPGNIKQGVSIFGVAGNYKGSNYPVDYNVREIPLSGYVITGNADISVGREGSLMDASDHLLVLYWVKYGSTNINDVDITQKPYVAKMFVDNTCFGIKQSTSGDGLRINCNWKYHNFGTTGYYYLNLLESGDRKITWSDSAPVDKVALIKAFICTR